MTSTMFVDIEDIEEKRDNLYSIIDERNRNKGRKEMSFRTVIISSLYKLVDLEEIGDYYKKSLRDICSNIQSDVATGIILFYSKHLIHIVEASFDVIIAYFREIEKNKLENGQKHFINSKIMVTSSQVTYHLYPDFQYHKLSEGDKTDNEKLLSDNDHKIIVELLSQLYFLGLSVYRNQNILSISKESLFDKFPEYIPNEVNLHHLLSKEVDCISTVETYLKTYDSPYDIRMDSDFVWPATTRKFPFD